MSSYSKYTASPSSSSKLLEIHAKIDNMSKVNQETYNQTAN